MAIDKKMRFSRVLAAVAALASCSGVVSLAPVAHRLTGALAPLTKPVAEALSPVWAGDYDKAAVRSSIKRETAEHSVVIYTMDFSLGLGSALQLLEEHGARGVKVVSLGAEWLPGLVADPAKRHELYALTGEMSLPHVFVGGKSIGGLFRGTPGLAAAARDGSLAAMLEEAGGL